MKKKVVYLGLAVDLIHPGHLNIINEAKKYGEVVVGLFTDSAIASYKRLPFMNYEQRKIVVENIRAVSRVIPQNTLDYTNNLQALMPDFVIHGDDWKEGIQKNTRQQVIDVLSEWNGELIEVSYTQGISSTQLITIQKEYIGRDSISNIKEIIEKIDAKKVLLVTGKESFSNSGAKIKLVPLLNGIEVVRFSDFEINPKLEDVFSGVDIVLNQKPDLIIAIGGGSVIDMAKLINILSAQKEHSALNIIHDCSLIQNKGSSPLLAIPTTSGTGSEATHFAVVYVDKKKYSLAHEFMLPNYVIVDSSLSYYLPKNIAASAAMDALSQAVESFWAVGSTIDSKRYAQQSIEIILESIEMAVVNMDANAKDAMALAANLSGKAINISKTTAAHAISYPITTYFNIPHGHAVALCLGKFFIINYNVEKDNVIDSRGDLYLKKVMKNLFTMFGCETAECCHDKWYKLMELIGLEKDMAHLGIRDDNDINLITGNVNLERLNNNPVALDSKKIAEIFS